MHTEAYDPAFAGAGAPTGVPWVRIEGTDALVIGHQFFGNRPLAVDGTFPDGAGAKVLWQFADSVSDLKLTATNLDDASGVTVELATNPANTAPASKQWPSSLAVPSAGCWRVDLKATDAAGHPVSGSVTYIVVE